MPSIDKQIEAVAENSVRSRRILALLALVSICTIIHTMHNAPWAWSRMHNRMLTMLLACENDHSLTDACDKSAAYRSLLVAPDKPLGQERVEQLYKVRDKTFSILLDNEQYINVPHLPLTIEANELSMIVSLTVFVLLLWLQFSLNVEYRNIRSMLLRLREDPDREHYFVLLSAKQLFLSSRERKSFWLSLLNLMPYTLIVIPYFITIVLYAFDCFTLKIGITITPVGTIINMAATSLLLAMNFLVVFHVVRVCRIMSKIWNEFIRLHLAHPVPPPPAVKMSSSVTE